MDNEMIERVAKAIFEKRYEAAGTYQNLKWEDYKGKEFYMEDARQAIKAMREPTEKMVDKGGYTYSTGDGMILDQAAKECWQTMIDCIVND